MKAEDILLLTAPDVASLLKIEDCIIAVEEAFRLHGEGSTIPPAVLSLHTHDGGFHLKAGILDLKRSYFGAKVNGNFPDNNSRYGLPTIQGVIVLCDAENGSPLAVMESAQITSLRTAAASAVAAKYLARTDSRTLTVCGSGHQGHVQAGAIASVRPIDEILTYDKIPERAERLAEQLTASLKIRAASIDDLAAAVRRSDICVTCTTSRQSLLGSGDVARGSFIAAVGADNPEKQELDPSLMAKSKIVADIIEQCAVMGDLHHALNAGVMTRADVHAELGEIVAGKKAGRESDEEIIIFDSTGMALQDVAAAAFVYEKALALGTGVRMDFAA